MGSGETVRLGTDCGVEIGHAGIIKPCKMQLPVLVLLGVCIAGWPIPNKEKSTTRAIRIEDKFKPSKDVPVTQSNQSMMDLDTHLTETGIPQDTETAPLGRVLKTKKKNNEKKKNRTVKRKEKRNKNVAYHQTKIERRNKKRKTQKKRQKENKKNENKLRKG